VKYLIAIVLAVAFATLVGEGVQAVGKVTTNIQAKIQGVK